MQMTKYLHILDRIIDLKNLVFIFTLGPFKRLQMILVYDNLKTKNIFKTMTINKKRFWNVSQMFFFVNVGVILINASKQR